MSENGDVKVHVVENEPPWWATLLRFLGNILIALSIAALPLIYNYYSKDRGVDSIIAKEAFEILKLELPQRKNDQKTTAIKKSPDSEAVNKCKDDDQKKGITECKMPENNSVLDQLLSVDFPSTCYDTAKRELKDQVSDDRTRLVLYKAWAIDTINAYQNGSNLGCGLKDFQLPSRMLVSERDLIAEMTKFEKAIYYERLGYEALFDKNLKEAIKNFQTSEDVYNKFHSSYEIAKYLRKYLKHEEIDWKHVYRHVLDNYIWKMPSDIEVKLREAVK